MSWLKSQENNKKIVLLASIAFPILLIILCKLTSYLSLTLLGIKLNLLRKSGIENVLFFTYIVILVFIFQKYVLKITLKQIGFEFREKIWLKELSLGWILTFCLALSYATSGVLTEHMAIFWDISFKKWANFLLYFPAAFGVALCEEWLFRGFLFNLFRKGFSTLVALILSSFIFSYAHFIKTPIFWTDPTNIFKFIGLFIIGSMLCTAYFWKKSLFLPIGLHAGLVSYNVLILRTRIFSYNQESIFYGFNNDPRTGLVTWCGLILLLIYFIRKISLEPDKSA